MDVLINIGFLNCLDDEKNFIDDLILKFAPYDGDAGNFTMLDVQKAFDTQILAIEKYTTPAALFSDLRTYLMARRLGAPAKEACPTEIEFEWIEFALTGECDLRKIGDLASIFMFAFPNANVEQVISRKLLFTDKSKIITETLKLAEGFDIGHLEKLLANFRNFHKRQRDRIILTLLDIIERKKEPSREITGVVLDMLDKEKKSFLKQTLKGFLEKYKDIKETLALDFEKFYDIFDHPDPETEFEHSPIIATLGARVARTLAISGIVNAKAVDRMNEILDNPLFDPGTRAMIAYSLGRMAYDDIKTKEKAADKLVKFLKRADFEEWQKALMPRPILESIVSLAMLCDAKSCNENILNLLSRFIYDMGHPAARLAATRAFGILGMKENLSDDMRRKIKDTLKDALADKEPFVRRTAYIWLNKLLTISR
jgi:hypothetical protein